MKEILIDIVPLVIGVIAGLFFFGGLWFTIQKGVRSKTPALLFMASFILRVGFLLLTSYYMLHWSLKMLVIYIIGFAIARILIVQQNNKTVEVRKEENHET